jgi:2-polyprenyl-3-methyl-5-hydroxy-6-metoxy-1,4-benzoquinol methylase
MIGALSMLLDREQIASAITEVQLEIISFLKDRDLISDHLREELLIASEEALQTLRLLCDLEISASADILEVGAGKGLASFALSKLGFSVTALEPGGIGFESNSDFLANISEQLNLPVQISKLKIEDVDCKDFGQFDIVVSNNALEHMEYPQRALSVIATILREDGIAVISCPNYHFPFEPHFGLPLMPMSPKLSKYFLPKRITQSSLWISLNFVTARQIRQMSTISGLDVQFRRGVMAQSFNRLLKDPKFAARHSVLARLSRYRLFNGLVKLPYWLGTPMNFVMFHKTGHTAKDFKNWTYISDM